MSEASEDILKACLLDLLYELRDADIPLTLGGGYGLYLKRQRAVESGERLLFDFVPPARSTNDLDTFLRTEIIADSARLRPLREALDRLGYAVIESAKSYQFARKFTLAGIPYDVKIDFLTRRPDQDAYSHVEVKARRVKPKPSINLHAHLTDEAIAVEDIPTLHEVFGVRTTGEPCSGVIYLPNAYAFLMMKLFALRDQIDNREKGFGQKHALDLYTLSAILTESEWETAQTLSRRYHNASVAQEAAAIVRTLFASDQSLGSLRLRENLAFPRETSIGDFHELLHELFPAAK